MMARYASTALTITGDLGINLSEAPDKTRHGVLAIMQEEGKRLEDYMKLNRPWTDRTGNAREGLKANVNYFGGDYVSIVLSHGVYYGVYLEYAMEKRFAIINPTILSQGPRVIEAFNNTMARLVK